MKLVVNLSSPTSKSMLFFIVVFFIFRTAFYMILHLQVLKEAIQEMHLPHHRSAQSISQSNNNKATKDYQVM